MRENNNSISNGKLRGKAFAMIGMLIIMIWIPLGCSVGILLPDMKDAREKAILSSCSGNLRNLGIVVTVYSTDHKGHYPQNLEVLIMLGYIERLPRCPHSKKSYIYEIDGWDDDSFTVRCPNPEKHIGKTGPESQTAELYFTSGKGVIQKDK
ncbi:hypothetical protein KAU33_09490 [Candidatus Dependentiae bacterium]|nr:hypothetical protein [Candidatus Dependentiae bacterium]